MFFFSQLTVYFSEYFRIEANFNKERVIVTFKSAGLAEVQPGAAKIYRKGNRLEVVL